jgi:LPXTG-motif cell wall-anchored protein
MKLCVKKAMAVFISIVIISMCCSIKSYAISMNLELSGDNITYSNGVYMCSKMIPVGGKMNIKAEYVTSNEMSPAPTGETSREDVSSQCTWKSSDEKIAKVSNGVIEGMAEITATYKERSATVSLAVGEDRVITIGDNISIVQKDNIKTVEKGKNLQLDIEGVESLTNAVKNEDVTWSSSDEKIATVDKSGLVTAIASGNVTIKAEYMSYSSTYDITITDDEEDCDYNIILNKDKIQLGVGNADTIEITAKLKDGISKIASVEMVKDNWNVEWKIEDETIAKCVPESGIENNINSPTQIAGRASIQGLKEETTKLLIKVKISENKTKDFEVPITVTTEKTDDKKVDNTISKKKLAQTGENNIIIIAMGIAVISMVVLYIKLKRKN